MTSPRDQHDLEQAAAETREPGEAARIRAEDDAETRARQADAGRELRADTARTAERADDITVDLESRDGPR
jgi:hypothetical protein